MASGVQLSAGHEVILVAEKVGIVAGWILRIREDGGPALLALAPPAIPGLSTACHLRVGDVVFATCEVPISELALHTSESVRALGERVGGEYSGRYFSLYD